MTQGSLFLEDIYFEPDTLPEGVIRGAVRNRGDASSPETRLHLTFTDDTDRVTGRIAVAVPPLEPGQENRFFARYRLKNTAFFRYLDHIEQPESTGGEACSQGGD